MTFQYPLIFLLALVLPLILKKSGEKICSLGYGNLTLIENLKTSFRLRIRDPLLKGLRIASALLFITALARPRLAEDNIWQETEGVDILLIVDASSSMLAEDFTLANKRYNRLEVVKRVITDFIGEREQDRIGVEMFSAEPMTLCPLTTDYAVLTEFLEGVHVGILPDGTAIGDAVAFGVNRMKKSKARSKIMILLTDGDNNAGQIDPALSADLAQTQKIKIYTIGAGSDGPVPYPLHDPMFGTSYQNVVFPLNEPLLKNIAEKTNGRYFRATDTESLKNIYEEINRLLVRGQSSGKNQSQNFRFNGI